MSYAFMNQVHGVGEYGNRCSYTGFEFIQYAARANSCENNKAKTYGNQRKSKNICIE